MGRQAENLTYVSNIHLMRCRSERSEEPLQLSQRHSPLWRAAQV